MNKKMFGYCGVLCSECPVFLATESNDDREKEKLALLWSKLLDVELKKEDMNCNGCLSDGPYCGYCQFCPVRLCARENTLTTSVCCKQFPCQKITEARKLCLLREAGV